MTLDVDVPGALTLLAAVVGPWAVTWREVLKLRASRHDTNQALTAVKLDTENIKADMADVKSDMREVRDTLLRAGVLKGGL